MNIICKKERFFKNPSKLPLNELSFEYKTLSRISKNESSLEEMMQQIEATPDAPDKWRSRYQIKMEKKPALDKYWVQEEKIYVEFHPFFPQFDDKENEQFLKKNREFLEILQHLLGCTYHQFWCYIVYEPRVSFIITHFLQHSLPSYVIPYLNKEFLKLYDKIYIHICRIYERLLEFKVSETEYMSETVVMGFLKKNELLNVRTIFLLCFLYNHSKPQFVKRLIDLYFSDKYKETYTKELIEMLEDIVQEFEKLNSLDLLSSTSSGSSMLRRRPAPDKLDPAWLEDTACYILEMASSVQEFLFLCKPAVEIALQLEMPNCLSHTYQSIYIQLYEMLELENGGEVGYDWSRYRMLIKQWLALGRLEFVNLFYGFTCYLLDKVIGLSDDRPEQEKYLEQYLGLISAVLDDELFIRDYNKTHPVEFQFQILIESVADFDKTQTDYLLESLQRMTEEDEPVEEAKLAKAPVEDEDEISTSVREPFPRGLYESIYDTLIQYSEVQQSSRTTPSSNEMTVLPEPVIIALKQYIELMRKWEVNPNCWSRLFKSAEPIMHFGENINKPSEEEIACRIKAVLEMLPDLESEFVLKCLERMDYRPEQVISKVLDGDLPQELVGSSRDADSLEIPGPSGSRVNKPKMIGYVGKKPGYADAKDLLDDKKEKQDIKKLVLNASYAYDLDDDYDDRNEVHGGAFERSDESKIYRHLKQPAHASEYNTISEPSSSSDNDNDEEGNQNKARPKDFCEDPAVIRARREAQRGRNFRGSTRDVTGRPKGQGQEKNVQQNRDKKNVQKSSRANHNRKGGAQWKHSRGMVPS